MEDSKTKVPSVIILITTISLAPMNVVLCAPALPNITEFFKITKGQTQELIALFLLGYAISQLIFGPLANSFGRKKSMIFGLVIGVIGCFICIVSGFVHGFSLLLIGRFVTGMGTAAGLVLSFTIINDVFTGTKARKVTGLCVMSFAVAPGVANFIGGFLTQYFGWISCFYFLAIYDIVVTLMVFKLPETLDKSLFAPLNPSLIVKGYFKALKNIAVIVSGIVYGMSVSLLYAVIALLPFIGINSLHMSPSLFGCFFLTSYVGYLLGSIITTATAAKLSLTVSIFIGIIVSLLGGAMLLFFKMIGCISIFTVFASIFIVYAGCPLVFINASIFGIARHNDKANASSILSFIYMILAFFTVCFAGKIHSNYLLTLTYGIVLMMIVSVVIYFSAIIRIERKNPLDNAK